MTTQDKFQRLQELIAGLSGFGSAIHVGCNEGGKYWLITIGENGHTGPSLDAALDEALKPMEERASALAARYIMLARKR